jgi:hypothetical protein
MKNLQRIADAYPGELEDILLSSMRDDAPSAEARKRTLLALGCAGVAVGVSTTAAAASGATKVSTWLVVGKWLSIGVVTSVAALSVAQEVPRLMARQSATPSARGATASQPATRKIARSAAAAVPAESGAVAPIAEAPLDGKLAAAGGMPSSARSGTASSNSSDSQLTKEVQSLDAVRDTLSRDPERALKMLAAQQHEFAHGALLPEAILLRIEALSASGQQAAAQALGREFLAAYPGSPHAEMVRGIVARESR